MTDAIDSAIKVDLQHLRTRYFVCLLVSTAIVGVGLLLELPEIAHDMWGIRKKEWIELKYWLAPSIARKEYRVPDWMKRWTAIGWLLIVLGVAGEGVFEGFVSWADGTLQTFNDTLLSQAQKEAGNAKASAEAAERASKQAQQAAKEIATEARMLAQELSRLRSEAGARRLSTKQKELLRKALETLPTPIAVGVSPIDSEAEDLRGDFMSALSDAHWTPVAVAWIPNGKYGIFLAFTDQQMTGIPAFKLLRDALKDIGMPPTLLTLAVGDHSLNGPAEAHVLYLLIGTHPPVNAIQKSAKHNKAPR